MDSTDSASIHRLIEHQNGLARKIGVWLKLKVQLKRLPLLNEYVASYESRYIRNRSKAQNTRRRQLRSVHEYCRIRYPTLGGGGFDAGNYEWVEIDRAKVDQVRKNRYAVTRELVQVICYLSEHPTGERKFLFTVGTDRITQFCITLNRTAVLMKAYRERHQIADARRVAEAHGYIEQLDTSRPGMSQKWIPGANNPHLTEFLTVYRPMVEAVRNRAGAKKPPNMQRWKRASGRDRREGGGHSKR